MPRGRPLLRRLRLPFRHECIMVPQRRIERRFPPYQSGALPLDDCGRLRWCWLEDSNLPPLAYEASALPDELSQLCKLAKGSRRRSRSRSDLVVRRGSAPRPNLDVHNVKERSANRRCSHRRMGS